MIRDLKILFIAIAVLAACGIYGYAQDGPPPAEKRFLIVVDVSEPMRKTSVAAQKAIEELLTTGMHGQLRDEDTLGVWTYNDQLHTDFQMQVWSETDKKAIINKAMSYLRLQRYAKKSRFERVMPGLLSVIKSSSCLTVVWVSDGSGKVIGTRFDKEINGLHNDFKKSLQDSGLPFVTVMAARAGDLFDYSVSSSIGPIRVPETVEPAKNIIIPDTNKIVQPAPAPAPVKPHEPIRVVVGPSKTNSIPTNTQSTVATQTVTAPAPLATAAPVQIAPPLTSTNIPSPAPAPTTQPTVAPVTNLVTTPVATEPAPVVPEVAVHETSNATSKAAVAPVENLTKNDVQSNLPVESAKPVQESTPAPVSVTKAPVQPLQANDLGNSYYSKLLLVISCVFLVMAVGMIVFLVLYLRRNKRHPSIISQSIKRQEKDSNH